MVLPLLASGHGLSPWDGRETLGDDKNWGQVRRPSQPPQSLEPGRIWLCLFMGCLESWRPWVHWAVGLRAMPREGWHHFGWVIMWGRVFTAECQRNTALRRFLAAN